MRGLLYEPEDATLDGTAALRPRRNHRTGSTFIELQVALVVFSIAVAGLCPLVVMQSRLIRKLETQAVGNAKEIAAVEGIDGLLIGTSDLTAELGISGQIDHPKVVEAYATVAAACKASGSRRKRSALRNSSWRSTA